MANKREFKKNVEAIGSAVIEPMFTQHYIAKDEEKKAIEGYIEKVLGAIGAACANADVTFDKGVKAFPTLKEYSVAKKDFYKKLFNKIKEDFAKEIDEALKGFNSLIPKEVKEENKKIVNG